MTNHARPEAPTQSYFVGQLAKQARRTEVAAPATLESLVDKLAYLTDDQIAQVASARVDLPEPRV